MKFRHSFARILLGVCLFGGMLAAAAVAAAQTEPAPAAAAPPAQEARPARAPRAIMVQSGNGSYLGVDVRDLSHEDAAALKLPDENGVEVTMVDQDSPAGKAGVKEHDVIRALNGEKVESRTQLRRMLAEIPAGHTADLQLQRNGQPLSLKVELGDRGRVMANAYSHVVVMPPMPAMPDVHVNIPMQQFEVLTRVARSGLQLEGLTPQLREFFGVPADQGLLVRSVEQGSAAQSAGLRAGDVIVKVGDHAVRDVSDYRMFLSDGETTVTVGIIRDKKTQSLTMKLPERRNSSSAQWNFDLPIVAFDSGQLAELKASLADIESQKGYWKEWEKSFKDSQKEWEKSMKDWEKNWRDWQ